MQRHEVLAVLVAGLAMLITGLVIIFGPWALVGSGAALAAAALTIFDVRGSQRGEAMAGTDRHRRSRV